MTVLTDPLQCNSEFNSNTDVQYIIFAAILPYFTFKGELVIIQRNTVKQKTSQSNCTCIFMYWLSTKMIPKNHVCN